jgi:hypothetical protein
MEATFVSLTIAPPPFAITPKSKRVARGAQESSLPLPGLLAVS